MVKASNHTTVHHRIYDLPVTYSSPLWQKDGLLKTVYKPNIAKTVYISILHGFMYKNKTVWSCIY